MDEWDVGAAAQLGEDAGYLTSVAVVDTSTGHLSRGGRPGRLFGSASLVKVMIAARLLAGHGMDADTERLARPMITGSDDAAANTLWDALGGPVLEPWVARHWDVDGLGSPNDIPGRWGNTHITACGLARLYLALRRDQTVWPWLGDALHAWNAVAADGTDQCFGLAAVRPHAAVKQGWADGSADDPHNAVVHTSGFLDGEQDEPDRYAVVVLTEGIGNVGRTDSRGLDRAQADTVTAITRTLVGAR